MLGNLNDKFVKVINFVSSIKYVYFLIVLWLWNDLIKKELLIPIHAKVPHIVFKNK